MPEKNDIIGLLQQELALKDKLISKDDNVEMKEFKTVLSVLLTLETRHL